MEIQRTRKTLLFSDRHAVMDAILQPKTVTERKTGAGWVEHEGHWQTRAVLAVLAKRGLLTVEPDA